MKHINDIAFWVRTLSEGTPKGFYQIGRGVGTF
ncbi:hypothetical protein HWB62_gp13 [Clostridium phage CPS2]|uniref:Uncharacterized protein n=1 Tax=Clostridium phage CPS2 TaxID=2175605 RepID=A0A343X844_9CAUD|nr:hypothetical protein HWB62_gp13 [Clostridium phage CPS2]AWG96520.1 hypothetical protein CPS2_13 [Clostridium phage CPS2]